MTARSEGGQIWETPVNAATNRLTGAVQYGSDGTLTSWNGNAYDPFGALIRYQSGAEQWMYLYTADGERVRSLRTGRPDHFYLRDLDGRLLRDYTVLEFQGDAWRSDFTFVDWIYRGDQPLATVDKAGLVRHLHLDHLGSVRLLTDANGDTAALHDYTPYGQEKQINAPGDRRWALHERDRLNTTENQADDLVYMHARHYNPTLGRFLAPDHFGGEPREVGSWNRYSYVLGSPISLVDPTGLWPAQPGGRPDPPPIGETIYDLGFGEQIFVAGGAIRISHGPVAWSGFNIRRPSNSFRGAVAAAAGPEFKLDLWDRFLSEIPIQTGDYADCVRQNRVDPDAAWLILGSAVPKRFLPPFSVPRPWDPLTTPLRSLVGSPLRKIAPGLSSAIRTSTRAVSKVATPAVLAEGAWDWTVLIGCAF